MRKQFLFSFMVIVVWICIYASTVIVSNRHHTAAHSKQAGMQDTTAILAASNIVNPTKFIQPIFNGKRFANPKSFTGWTGFPTLKAKFKRTFLGKNASNIPSQAILKQTLPVYLPKFPLDVPLAATWLGHATVWVRLDGIALITDPVWAKLLSPVKFIGFSRYRPVPCAIHELPLLHVGVISHNHYDHLDTEAVQKISKQFPHMKWFVPKGLKNWMQRLTHGSVVHEMSWGEQFTWTVAGKKYTIWCIPAQHSSQRGLFDRNRSLWCGWAVIGPEHKFYYTGDTGFCVDEFQKVGKQLGPFDLSAIPIGCYAPRWYMKSHHINPTEAVAIHQLTKSLKSIGIHWGTYAMASHEHYLEPKIKLQQAVAKAGLLPTDFFTLNHGGTWTMAQNL